MNTVKLTMAQALVRFLDMQYVCVDGKEEKFVHGIMGIFGHGNVVGLGQALEQYADRMPFIQGKNEQEIAHVCVAFAKRLYPEFCVNSALDVKQSKIFTRRHCNSRPPL